MAALLTLKAKFCRSNRKSMDSEITMNYVVLLFSVTSEETPYEQNFCSFPQRKKNKIDDD